jgi:hypothetical protein
VGEITIPEPVISDDFDDLPKASVLRALADITEGWKAANEVLDQECATLGAAAYDQDRGLIYVTEQGAGPWGETVVHVWEESVSKLRT